MKLKLVVLSLIMFCVPSIEPVYAQSLPNCLSAASDSDGDGFGWENSRSCTVVVPSASQCEDRGDFPWGWNPVTLSSCRLDNVMAPNSTQIGITLAGSWYCQLQVITSDFFDPGVSRSGAFINETVRWAMKGVNSSSGGRVEGSIPEECVNRQGEYIPSVSRYIFEDNGDVTISQNLIRLYGCADNPGVDTFRRTELGGWQFDGNTLVVNGQQMSEFGIQYKTSFGESYRLLNLYIDNANRLACRAVDGENIPEILIF